MVRLAIRMTSSGRSSYRRLAAKRASFSPRETSLPSPTSERCVSCAIVIETGTPIPNPVAPTCVRKRRREVRSTSLIILCASVDIPSPDMHDHSRSRPLPVWCPRNRTFLDTSQQATERAKAAYGTKRTCQHVCVLSALAGIADIGFAAGSIVHHVCSWLSPLFFWTRIGSRKDDACSSSKSITPWRSARRQCGEKEGARSEADDLLGYRPRNLGARFPRKAALARPPIRRQSPHPCRDGLPRVPASVRDGLDARRLASASASSSKLVLGTTRLIRPRRAASVASNMRPVRISSMAAFRQML